DWHAQANLASLYSELGDAEAARAALTALGAPNLSALPLDFLWLFSMCELGRAAAMLEDTELAVAAYDRILPYEALNVTVGPIACAGAAVMFLGILATAVGRYDDAIGHLERA